MISQDEFRRMFEKEERLLEESHKKTVERHEEIMRMIEQARESAKRKM